jgi:hypothetical protein
MRNGMAAVLVLAMLLGGCGEGVDAAGPQTGGMAERRGHAPGAQAVTSDPPPAEPPTSTPPASTPPMNDPPAAPPATPAGVSTPPVTAGPVEVPPVTVAGPNVDAKAIQADRLIADVVFVGELHAQSARIDQPVEDDKEKRYQVPGVDDHLQVPAVQAQIVRAESITVGYIEARQVFARSIKIDAQEGGGMGKPKGKQGEAD